MPFFWITVGFVTFIFSFRCETRTSHRPRLPRASSEKIPAVLAARGAAGCCLGDVLGELFGATLGELFGAALGEAFLGTVLLGAAAARRRHERESEVSTERRIAA